MACALSPGTCRAGHPRQGRRSSGAGLVVQQPLKELPSPSVRESRRAGAAKLRVSAVTSRALGGAELASLLIMSQHLCGHSRCEANSFQTCATWLPPCAPPFKWNVLPLVAVIFGPWCLSLTAVRVAYWPAGQLSAATCSVAMKWALAASAAETSACTCCHVVPHSLL